eukprot:g165.t1
MVQQNLTAFSHSVDLRGPLTKDITAESFSERLVPFTLTTWLCLLFLYLIFFAHEMYAARVKPLWANEQKASSLMFQSSVLFYWFYWYVNEAMLLPVTLDFAVSMGQSATMSGFFISSSLIALILGLFMGKKLVPEASFDQRRARSLLVWSNLVATLFMLLEAAVCNSAVHWSMPAKGVVFWVMILISQAHGFVGALPYVPLMVMWGKFTPKSEMLANAEIFVAASASGLASVLLNALVIPQQMPPLPDADADDAEEPEDVTLSNDPKTERSVEELELPQRQEVCQESTVFFACNAIALVGVIFLFDFGTGAFGLLLADGLVYGCASVSNGIAEGWASRAAKEGSDFSIEVYRTWNMSLACAARFMAPMVARTVLDFGGRNLYAALQLVMVALSTSTVYRAASMLWNKAKNGKEV